MAAVDLYPLSLDVVPLLARMRVYLHDLSTAQAASFPKLTGVVAVAAGYRKDPLGNVELKGLVKGGSVGAAAFTLPVGYRPAEDVLREVHSEDASNSVLGAVTVKTTGDVVVSTGGNALVSLDGIRFKAA